ncbi:BRCT domain-containing protein [Desulforhopalus vacuolatus]|uniref:BRCT domain-containing protein n=1 Tax=Desulforhopalus vacuolatus TaxID=40414 RepID=UPI001965DBCA|nr:BRCT domain-containing protein [Desulforhopalus vacuolatus]MBM9519532.1 BRCT domain-containing protein [Desulforhopalus vacuolatus]
MSGYKKRLLDDHGQPIDRRYNYKRLNDRNIDELIGLCKGIVADNRVNLDETIFLQNWMEKHSTNISDPIINALYCHIHSVLADGIIDEKEEKELFKILTEFTGESTVNSIESIAATLPLDRPEPKEIIFNKKIFCLTGKFSYAPRKICEEETKKRGANTSKGVTLKTDYLVIGTFCSRDWSHTSYGRKIEKAVGYRDQRRTGIQIVHEDYWANFLTV